MNSNKQIAFEIFGKHATLEQRQSQVVAALDEKDAEVIKAIEAKRDDWQKWGYEIKYEAQRQMYQYKVNAANEIIAALKAAKKGEVK